MGFVRWRTDYVTRCPRKEDQNYPESSQDQTWFYKEWSHVPKSYSSSLVLIYGTRPEQTCNPGDLGPLELKVRREGQGLHRVPQSPDEQHPQSPSSQAPQNTQPGAWVPGQARWPHFCHFPQALSSSPCILERAAMRIGPGLLWSACDWWSETLLQRQKKTSCPKSYKHTLHSLNVFVKYWKHRELHSAAPLAGTHTHISARHVGSLGRAWQLLPFVFGGGLTDESWTRGFSFSGHNYKNVGCEVFLRHPLSLARQCPWFQAKASQGNRRQMPGYQRW